MLYLISLLPIAMYLIGIKALDGMSVTRWGRVATYYVWGVLCCVICFFAFNGSEAEWVAPLVEELLKCAPLIISLVLNRTAFFAETLVLGCAVGAGFASCENVLYVMNVENLSIGDAVVRGFGTSLLHMGCTALYACCSLVVLRLLLNKNKAAIYAACTVTVAFSFGVHSLYNLFLLPELYQLIIVLAVMPAFFLLIYEFDRKLILKWLDRGVSTDVSLYASIREGRLRETNAGKYLISMQSKFTPEEFFDILSFVRVYLELSIAAKSRMIMKEAGLDIVPDEATHKANLDKIAEMRALYHSIGATGIMTVNPVLHMSAEDYKTIKEML